MRILTFLTTLLLLYTNNVFSCDCANKPSIDSAAKNSAFIFSGKMIAQTKITVLMQDTVWTILDSTTTGEPFVYDYIKYTFAIKEKFKGIRKKKTIDVYSPAGSASCGFQFQKEQVYIIYGDSVVFSQYNGENTFGARTTTCDRTEKFNKQEKKDICQILKKVK